MQNKNTLIWVIIVIIALLVGAFWGSKYGFSLKGPLKGVDSNAGGSWSI